MFFIINCDVFMIKVFFVNLRNILNIVVSETKNCRFEFSCSITIFNFVNLITNIAINICIDICCVITFSIYIKRFICIFCSWVCCFLIENSVIKNIVTSVISVWKFQVRNNNIFCSCFNFVFNSVAICYWLKRNLYHRLLNLFLFNFLNFNNAAIITNITFFTFCENVIFCIVTKIELSFPSIHEIFCVNF